MEFGACEDRDSLSEASISVPSYVGPERRRWSRIPLAIPVFVRAVDAKGRRVLEFATLLNESAGGALLVTPISFKVRSRISLQIPCRPMLSATDVPAIITKLFGRVLRSKHLGPYSVYGVEFSKPLNKS